jgi:hypothetical protein
MPNLFPQFREMSFAARPKGFPKVQCLRGCHYNCLTKESIKDICSDQRSIVGRTARENRTLAERKCPVRRMMKEKELEPRGEQDETSYVLLILR